MGLILAQHRDSGITHRIATEGNRTLCGYGFWWEDDWMLVEGLSADCLKCAASYRRTVRKEFRAEQRRQERVSA